MLLQAVQKAGLTKVVQLRSKLVFSTFPIRAKRKNTLGSNSTSSLSYHHFGLVLPSRGKRRVDEGRPIAFKTRFFDFPHRGETNKHPWDRFPRGRFHTTILGGLYEAAENAGMTKSFQLGCFRCLVKPSKNRGMKPTSWNSNPRVFFCFAPMGKVEKTSFERNWTTFVNPAFCVAGKSPPKMVV